MIFNKYLKYIPLLGIVVIALCVGFVSVKADKNFFLYKVKGIAQNNYEGTAIINAGNKYVQEYVSNFPYTKFFIDLWLDVNETLEKGYLHLGEDDIGKNLLNLCDIIFILQFSFSFLGM